MHVPDPVISLSLSPAKKGEANNFNKALQRFTKEDPTFRSHVDEESGEPRADEAATDRRNRRTMKPSTDETAKGRNFQSPKLVDG